MWPCATHAQQSMPVVGFISPAAPHSFQDRLRAFHKGLKEAGYVEGQNVAIEYRWAYDQVERLPELAADLVRRGVSVIAALGGTPTALAAKAATQSIPVVFYVGVDPVERGIVAGLSRPGGNLTGVSSLAIELVPKRVEVLHELIPAATSVALLVDPDEETVRQNVAFALGLKAIFLVTTLLGITGLWPAILSDTGATVLVTANALRLLRFKPGV